MTQAHHHAHEGGADRWSHLDEPGRDEWQKPDVVVWAAGIEQGHVIADIGAGTGYFEVHLSRAVGPNGKVFALDANPKLVEHMRQRFHVEGLSNVEVRVLHHDDPELGPGSLDRALIVDLWHHLHDRVAYARKVRTALRPGGRLLVVDRDAHSSHAPPEGMRFSLETVVAELKEAGFSARILPHALPRQFMVEGAVPSATPPASRRALGGTSE
jgi:arsenite methyltransferase